MNMSNIIVPTDFTSTSDVAVHYALNMSRVLNAEVHLLHVVKNESEKEAALSKMNAQINSHSSRTGKTAKTLVVEGSIFEAIPAETERMNAQLVVMGTHGLKGFQFITGSNALRVITESKAPFIVVQETTKQTADIKKILVPLDLHKETKQKIKIAGDIAEKYKAEVHIVVPKETDEYLHNQVMRNLSYAEGYFESRGIAQKGKVMDGDHGSFVKEIVKYGQYAEIDLICILNFAGEQLIHAFGTDAEQKMITNEAGIPVMVINPVHANLDSRTIFAQ
jgi:nucleotide-binding universal stress UspA family protein